MQKSRRGNLASVIVITILFIFLGGGAYLIFKDTTAPTMLLSPISTRTSPKQEFTLVAADEKSGIRSINVNVRKGDRSYPILSKTFSETQASETVTFNLTSTGIKEGNLELEIKVADASYAGFGGGNVSTQNYQMQVDMTPPRFDVKTMPPYIRRGGTANILYSVNKDVVKTGVKVGDNFFEGHKQASGEYLAFFAFPYNLLANEYAPSLMAEDSAGNIGSIPLAVNRIHREFRHDNIEISENFLATKMPEFEVDVPGQMSNLERFIKVNNDLRKANQDKLREIGQKSHPEILWEGAFLRLPNAATRAGFADHRSYFNNKQKIDEQTHLGQDLASLAQSPVPAANNGIVAFTGDLGIYGKLVVVDHGCGLQTLYSHLTDISVEQEQKVKKGDTLGRTGKSGMAAGDHLHFGVTVGGIEVMPIEWFDSHWIKDNIIDRVVSAGGVMPSIDASASTIVVAPNSSSGANSGSGASAKNIKKDAKKTAPQTTGKAKKPTDNKDKKPQR